MNEVRLLLLLLLLHGSEITAWSWCGGVHAGHRYQSPRVLTFPQRLLVVVPLKIHYCLKAEVIAAA